MRSFFIASLFVICSLSLSAQKKDSTPPKRQDSVQYLLMSMEQLNVFIGKLEMVTKDDDGFRKLLTHLSYFIRKEPVPQSAANKAKQ